MPHLRLVFVALLLSGWLLPRPSAYSESGQSTQLAQAGHSGAVHSNQSNKAASTAKGASVKTDEKAKLALTSLKPAEGAKIKILSPTKDQVFKGDKIPIQYKLTKGKRGHHAHAYVDGELMGMFESEKGTLNGVKPGKHVLELRVVATDHETELDATDKINFTVK